MDWIGKFLTPVFLLFFFFIMITALLHPLGNYQAVKPVGEYASALLISGVLAGYNTMDALAGLAFGIANVGLTTIISFSLPVLMLLYPLAISLILLALTSKLFDFKQVDHQIMTAVTFLCALGDFFKALPAGMQVKAVTSLDGCVLPLYQDGLLGWLVPVAVTFVILAIKAAISKKRS